MGEKPTQMRWACAQATTQVWWGKRSRSDFMTRSRRGVWFLHVSCWGGESYCHLIIHEPKCWA